MKYLILIVAVLVLAAGITVFTGTNACEAASFGQVTC